MFVCFIEEYTDVKYVTIVLYIENILAEIC